MPFAELNTARLWYEFEGPASAPAIVFCNSLGADVSMWDAQAAVLQRHFRVLRYDVRGHGSSGCPAGPCTIADLGQDLLDLLDHLSLDVASFCGISMGGLTGMWLAVNAPERLHRLVLSNTAAKIGTEASWSDRIDRVSMSGLQGIVDDVMKRWFTSGLHAPATAREMFLRTSQAGYLHCCEAIRTADYRLLVSEIRLPTLVIAGSDDVVTTTADAQFLEKSIQGAAYIEVSGAHLPNLESPAEYSDILTRFMTR